MHRRLYYRSSNIWGSPTVLKYECCMFSVISMVSIRAGRIVENSSYKEKET